MKTVKKLINKTSAEVLLNKYKFNFIKSSAVERLIEDFNKPVETEPEVEDKKESLEKKNVKKSHSTDIIVILDKRTIRVGVAQLKAIYFGDLEKEVTFNIPDNMEEELNLLLESK